MIRKLFLSFLFFTVGYCHASERFNLQTQQASRTIESIGAIKSNDRFNRIETNMKLQLTDYSTDDNGDAYLSAVVPDVAYDPVNERYIVVYTHEQWANNNPVYSECRILFVDALTGDITNQNIAVSDQYDVLHFSGSAIDECNVAVDTVNGGFIVVSSLMHNNGGNREIRAKRFSSQGLPLDVVDLDISEIPNTYKDDFDANRHDVVFNPDTLEYLIAWEQRGFEIFDFIVLKSQINVRPIPVAGPVTTNVVTVTSMGELTDGNIRASFPKIAYHPITKEYLMTFGADGYDINNQNLDIDNIDNQWQIHVLRLDQAGNRIGDSIKITDLEINGNYPAALRPQIAYYHDPYGVHDDGYYLIWHQKSVNNQDAGYAVYGRKLNDNGLPAAGETEILSFDPEAKFLDISYLPSAQQFVVMQESGDEHLVARLNLANESPKVFNQNANEAVNGVASHWSSLRVAAADLDYFHQRNYFAVWAEATDGDNPTYNLFGTFLKPIVVE